MLVYTAFQLTPNINPRERQRRPNPRCKEKNVSRGVNVARDSISLVELDRKRKNRGEARRGRASRENILPVVLGQIECGRYVTSGDQTTRQAVPHAHESKSVFWEGVPKLVGTSSVGLNPRMRGWSSISSGITFFDEVRISKLRKFIVRILTVWQ